MKTAKILLVLLAIIVLIPLFGYFLWVVQKSDKMDLMIVNKTVEKVSENEMRSLNWVLNYNKIVKSSSNSYNYEKDYFGYHPEPVYENQYIRSFRLDEIETLKEDNSKLSEKLGKYESNTRDAMSKIDDLLSDINDL